MESFDRTAQGSHVGEFQHNSLLPQLQISIFFIYHVPPSQRSHQSYLPGKEPADTNDTQDVEHSRAHDGANSHVTLGDEHA